MEVLKGFRQNRSKLLPFVLIWALIASYLSFFRAPTNCPWKWHGVQCTQYFECVRFIFRFIFAMFRAHRILRVAAGVELMTTVCVPLHSL